VEGNANTEIEKDVERNKDFSIFTKKSVVYIKRGRKYF